MPDILEKFLASQQESFSAFIQVASYVALATLKLIKQYQFKLPPILSWCLIV